MSRHGLADSPSSTPGPASRDWVPVSGARLLAVAVGTLLVGSYLSIFYHIVDVVGGVRWLALGVGGALLLATLVARVATARTGVLLGVVLVVAGVVAYLAAVPDVYDGLFTVDFAVQWLGYLTGVSVLQFQRVDVWAVVLAPGVAFLSWVLLLRRRYDGSALVGGLMLGFFALTGDAGPTVTLLGMTSLLGLLGVGSVERSTGTWREVTRLGFLVAVAVLVARWFRVVPEARASAGSGGSGGAVRGDLASATERANIYESITLSAKVLFAIEADAADYWQVAAYDRYTGSDWIRTGGTRPYDGRLDAPPGETTRNEQTVSVERGVQTLPAAWKPVAVEGVDPARVRVTDLGGLSPFDSFDSTDRYRVRSEVVDASPGRLREAGSGYPQSVRERYLQLPESTPRRVRRLAERVGGDAGSPYDAAVAVRRWLLSNKSYDLTVDRPPGDVVDAFLFSMERGYCVYFASAMVVMLRSLGVPARFVLGYSTGQPVGDGQWVVRGLDSHAWVQVYVPDVGWIRFDPTPGGPRRSVRNRTLNRARAENATGVDTNESRSVDVTPTDSAAASGGNGSTPTDVGPNASVGAQQPAAVGGSLSAERGSGGSTTTPAGPVDAWLADRDRLDALVGAASVALGLHWVGAFERGYRAVRVRWQRPTDSPRRDVERAYERLELLLAGRFRPRRPEETRRQYVERASDVVDDERVRRVLDLYERTSYAGRVSRAEADEAIRTVDSLVGAGR